MKRLRDWQERFDALVAARLARPLSWGVHDCALFAADAVEAITGVRLCPELRAYASARQAARLLASLGGVRGLAARELGAQLPARAARVGDVVVLASGKREALGVCNGQTAIGAGAAGLVQVPMRQALAAWKVG